MPMEELLGELFDAIKNGNYRKPKGDISILLPMTGTKYFDQKTKFMLVGRAANGWDPLSKVILRENFITQSINELHNARFTDWILEADDPNKKLKNGRPKCNIHLSSFWRTGKQVLESISSLKDQERWYECIAWSNLYMVSPSEKGNPSTTLMSVQRDICKKILLHQIEDLAPDFLLFLTDWNWLEEYGIDKDLNLVKLSGEGLVVSTGHYEQTRIVVSKRPDRKKECCFINAICNAIDN
jgi:hypothetical protein